MKLEAVGKPFTYQWPGGQIRFEPGRVIDVEEARALRIMAKAPGRVRPIKPVKPSVTPPDTILLIPPIEPGWFVTYIDRRRKLQGGAEDRAHGTVKECRREAGRWMVYLTDGQQVFLERIVGVAKVNAQGRIVSAWRVKEHGFDGERGAS